MQCSTRNLLGWELNSWVYHPPERGEWPEPVARTSRPTRVLSPDISAFKLWFISQSLVSLVGVSQPSELADFYRVSVLSELTAWRPLWPVQKGFCLERKSSLSQFMYLHISLYLSSPRVEAVGRLGSQGSGLYLLTPFMLTLTGLEEQGEEGKELVYQISCQVY